MPSKESDHNGSNMNKIYSNKITKPSISPDRIRDGSLPQLHIRRTRIAENVSIDLSHPNRRDKICTNVIISNVFKCTQVRTLQCHLEFEDGATTRQWPPFSPACWIKLVTGFFSKAWSIEAAPCLIAVGSSLDEQVFQDHNKTNVACWPSGQGNNSFYTGKVWYTAYRCIQYVNTGNMTLQSSIKLMRFGVLTFGQPLKTWVRSRLQQFYSSNPKKGTSIVLELQTGTSNFGRSFPVVVDHLTKRLRKLFAIICLWCLDSKGVSWQFNAQ